MRASTAAIAIIMRVAALMTAGTSHAQKASGTGKQTRTEVFDTVGAWRVLAVWNSKDAMRLTCSAYYKMDERLGRLYVATLSKNADSKWKIELRNENWPVELDAIRDSRLIDQATKQPITTNAPTYSNKSIAFAIGATAADIQKLQNNNRLHLELKSPSLKAKARLPRTADVINRINACHQQLAKK